MKTTLLTISFFVFLVTTIIAAPYPPEGLETSWTQPTGQVLQLRVFGDEFYARTETLSGHTVLFDGEAGRYCYATVDPVSGEWVSTGVSADEPPPVELPAHIEESESAALRKHAAMVAKMAPNQEARWKRRVQALRLKQALDAGPVPAPDLQALTDGLSSEELAEASSPVSGGYVGLMILVQFPDDSATPANDPVNFPVTQAKIERYCNQTNYTEDGNTGSIKDYFSDQSLGQLTLTQSVTQIITLPNPRNFYNYSNYPTNTSLRPSGQSGRLMVEHAIAILKTQSFNFSNLSVNGSNQVRATSLLFAGADSGQWPLGLWPHKWSLNPQINVGTVANPRYINEYQCTNVNSAAPVIGTNCHELGHLLLGYPDLYDTVPSNGSSAGVGEHCLMGSGNHLNSGRTPAPIGLYLKSISGWANITTLTATQNLQTGLPSTGNVGYRFSRPGSTSEFFIVENRGTGDPWAAHCRDKGIAIWHIDESVSHNGDQQMTPSQHYRVSLEQADGRFDLEMNANRGDADDLYDQNTQAFTDTTTPNARWWPGTNSGVSITALSAPGATMQVKFGSGAVTLATVSTTSISSVTPNSASSGGNVTNAGGSAVTERGLVFATFQNPTLANGTKVISGSGTGTFTSSLSGLTPSTTYYARAYAINSAGTGYGSQISFTTLAAPAAIPLADALDAPSLTWSSGGTAPWLGQTTVTHDGVDAARSGVLTHSQESWVQTTVTGPGTLTFWWRVSSESNYDWLEFHLNGVLQDGRISGEVAWQQKSFNLPAGTHTLRWRYAKDGSVSNGADAGYVDQVVFTSLALATVSTTSASGITHTSASSGGSVTNTGGSAVTERGVVLAAFQNPTLANGTKTISGSGTGSFTSPLSGLTPSTTYYARAYAINSGGTAYGSQISFSTLAAPVTIPLAEALDTPTLTWSAGGITPWTGQTTVTHDGVDAARSGILTHSQESWMQTTVTGPGALTFWWSVSSENGFDWLEFYVNGVLQNERISGEVAWQQQSFNLSAGTNTLRWRYSKDGSVNNGADAGYVDQVVFISSALPTVSTTAASSLTHNSANSGGNVTNTGGSAVTERGVVLATFQNPTIANGTKAISGSGTGTYSSALSGLNPNTTYYARAYAINNAGTAYGSQISFTTLTAPAGIPLAEALDAPALTWSSGGTAPWTGQTAVTHDGVDAARSGLLTHSQESWMQTTVAGPGTLSFWWRVSSESNYDWLEFHLNGVLQDGRISGEVAWQQKSLNLPAGTHTLRWRYSKDGSVNSGADAGYVDEVVFASAVMATVSTTTASGITHNSASSGGNVTNTGGSAVTERGVVFATFTNPTLANGSKAISGSGTGAFSSALSGLTPNTTYYARAYAINSAGTAYGSQITFATLTAPAGIPLAEALDAPALTWSSGGTAPWTGQTAVTHDGVDAARSGLLTHSQESWMQTTVTGPGTLSFWWRVSSESNYDWLEFQLNGVLQEGRISGEVAWLQKTFTLPVGTHTLRWRYIKDGSVNTGADAGYVDQVVFTPSVPIPVIALTGNLNFGYALIGQSSTRTLTIQNTGTMPLNVTQITYPAGFSGNWNSGSIAAGSSVNVTVTFTPIAEQNYSGSVTVTSNAVSGENTRNISGVGSNVVPPSITWLSNNAAIKASGAQGTFVYYAIEVPEGQSMLIIELYGGTGDGDLFIRHGNLPTESIWDYRPYLGGNNERVVLTTPAAGVYYIMLHGYDSYRNASLRGRYIEGYGSRPQYKGLLQPTNPAFPTNNAAMGQITGSLVKSRGSMSGKVWMDGKVTSYRGMRNSDGSVMFRSGRTLTNELVLKTGELHGKTLQANCHEHGLEAEVRRYGVFLSAGLARPKLPAAPSSLLNLGNASRGQFTVAFPSKLQSPPKSLSTYPQGTGYASLKITRSGAATLAGRLADGTAIISRSFLVPGDEIPFFLQLPTPGATAGTRGGSLSGTLSFDPTASGSNVYGVNWQWFRPAVFESAKIVTHLYTDGWPGGLSLDPVGAFFQPFWAAQYALYLNPPDLISGNALLRFGGGRLAFEHQFTNFNITLNRVRKILANDSSFSLSINSKTGVFSGTFTPAWNDFDTTPKQPVFRGVLLQGGPQPGGSGYYISNGRFDYDPESGWMRLEPQ